MTQSAAQSVSAKDQLQVSVVGMGDGTDANFPAIYPAQFGERTFDPSKGGWDCESFTSYAYRTLLAERVG